LLVHASSFAWLSKPCQGEDTIEGVFDGYVLIKTSTSAAMNVINLAVLIQK
jgi:hypothetical protein